MIAFAALIVAIPKSKRK
ncbi:MAG: hypothetical protein FWE77_05465 [Clostridia bacterium]|nr:hypothetical protein [Clostridia bacterium]